MIVGCTAFSGSSENARMVPAFSAATMTQMTVKRIQSFFQRGIYYVLGTESGRDAAGAGGTVVRAPGGGLGPPARPVFGGARQERLRGATRPPGVFLLQAAGEG